MYKYHATLPQKSHKPTNLNESKTKPMMVVLVFGSTQIQRTKASRFDTIFVSDRNRTSFPLPAYSVSLPVWELQPTTNRPMFEFSSSKAIFHFTLRCRNLLTVVGADSYRVWEGISPGGDDFQRWDGPENEAIHNKFVRTTWQLIGPGQPSWGFRLGLRQTGLDWGAIFHCPFRLMGLIVMEQAFGRWHLSCVSEVNMLLFEIVWGATG